MRLIAHHFAVSVVVALFALLSLAFGGSTPVGPRGHNGLSSQTKDGQPTQVSARDTLRAVMASDRKTAPKPTDLDGGAAPAIVSKQIHHSVSTDVAYQPLVRQLGPPGTRSHKQPRGPPALQA